MRAPAFVALFALCLCTHAFTQTTTRSGDEGFARLAQLYSYDATLPLNARILQRVETATYVREKFIIDGWRGSRAPGLIAFPKANTSRAPIILLIDGLGGWKERWWQRDSWNRGAVLIDSLLASGYAVVMIDAFASGERTYENNFVTAESFSGKFPQWRDLVFQNTIEHRRLLDYLATRSDVDTARIGALGLSLGGVTLFVLGAFEPRIKAGVAGLTPIQERIPEIVRPANYAGHLGLPLLMLMGRTDAFYNAEHVDQLFKRVGSKEKQLVWYDVGHRLPEEYAGAAVDWFRKQLR